MTIKIHITQENTARKDRSTLFNYLGKTATGISLSLMAYSFMSSYNEVEKLPESRAAAAAEAKKNGLLTEQDKRNYSGLASILLASIGLSFRKKYALEKNMQPQFTADSAHMDRLHDLIALDKSEASEGNLFYDRMVERGDPVPIPSLDLYKIYPLLFMTGAEIDDLTPRTKACAYLAQNKCMTHFINEALDKPHRPTYEPDMPATPQNGHPVYRYDDILATLQKDHDVLSDRLKQVSPGIRFEIREDMNERKIKETLDDTMDTNGTGTAVLAFVAPLIPLLYSNVSASFNNFVAKTPILKDYNPAYQMIKQLETQARVVCHHYPNNPTSTRTDDYHPVTVKITAAPSPENV